MEEYKNILVLCISIFIITFIIFFLSYFTIIKSYNWEKVSSYECGFQPFDDSRNKFDIKFYLVAILFIIFDLEISYLFPWALSIYSIKFLGLISMMIFLIILTIGFVYEWMKGALEWN